MYLYDKPTIKLKTMQLEIDLNNLDGDWWFNLGITFDSTKYNPDYKYLVTIGLAFFSVYIRFIKR